MEGIRDMGIREFRLGLGERIDAAFFHGESTVIRHAKKGEPRAELVPPGSLAELEAYRAKYGPLTDD